MVVHSLFEVDLMAHSSLKQDKCVIVCAKKRRRKKEKKNRPGTFCCYKLKIFYC